MQSSEQNRILRPLLIGSVLVFVNCYWIVNAEAVWFTVHMTVISLFFNSIFTLFIILVLNQFLRKLSPKSILSNSELLMTYAMVNMGTAMAGHGFMQLLIPIMGHAFWYATPENEWADTFHRYLPEWLTVQDRDILRDHYRGNSTFYTVEHLEAWIVPILSWTAFIFVFVFVMICINAIVRKQWVEQEKLAYPMIQLPYEMIEQTPSFFRSNIMWIGFGIAAGLDILNGIHQIWPSVPGIHLKLNNIGRYLVTKPWNAVGWLPISFYPFVIGMAFFIPLDLSFSLWFFYLFWKAQRVMLYVIGATSSGGSYAGFRGMVEQASGAYLAIFFIAMWVSRRHLALVIRKIFGQKNAIDDSNEPISYRMAVLGLVIGGAFLLGFSYQAGMSIWVGIVFFVVYYAIITSITRMRAEMGVPVHDMHNGGPDLLMSTLFGTRMLGPRNLSVLSLYWFFNRAHYSDPMPYQLETFKLAERTKSSSRNMFIAMCVAALLGILTTFWAFFHMSHDLGMAGRLEWFGWEPYNRLQRWITNPTRPDYSTATFLSIGFVITIFFTIMRSRFLWWPLHPAGYAVSNSWGLAVTWFPILISCTAKFVILRYGGMKAHRRAMPFFAGLILGEFVVGSIWSIIGGISGIRTYAFWVY